MSVKQAKGEFEEWYESVKVHRLSHWDEYTLVRKAFEAGAARKLEEEKRKARLEEAKWWHSQFSEDLMSEPEFVQRIAELEAS